MGKIVFGRARLDVIDKLATMVINFISLITLMDLFGLNINTLIAFGGIGGLALPFHHRRSLPVSLGDDDLHHPSFYRRRLDRSS